MNSNISVQNSRRHRRINDFLTLIAALLAMYILLLPLIPNITLWWARRSDDTQGFVYASRLLDVELSDTSEQPAPIPEENRLVLPMIQLNEEVYEGKHFSTLNKGLWRVPHTSTPDKGSNTVIIAHRFTYGGPAQFYHLDKMKIGDKFPLYWEGVEYNYEVYDSTVVSPLAVEVEAPTKDPILTLYTCTPLWSASERLVIKARLIEGSI